MDIRSQSALLAAVVTIALGVSMLLRPERAKASTLFSVFCFSLSAYYLGDFLWSISGEGHWMRAAVGSGSVVPATALAFFLEFLGVSRRSARRARALAVTGALGGLAVAVTPLANLQTARVVVGAWVFGALALSISILWRRMTAAISRIERARLAYLFYGATFALVTSALDLLPRFGVAFPAMGAMSTSLFLFFLAQTLQRYRLLDLHELAGKFAALAVLAGILAAIYGGLVVWVGNKPGLFLFNTLVASFVILNLYEPLRDKVEEGVIATLFRERFELLRTLSSLKARIATVIDPIELARVLLDTLHESRRVTHASLYLLAEARPGFALVDSRGPAPAPFLEAGAARGLLAAAAGGLKAVLLENIERRYQEVKRLLAPAGAAGRVTVEMGEDVARLAEEVQRLGEIRVALASMKAGICIPLGGPDRVIGFLNLWDERVAEAYSSDEIALMLEIGDQVATTVENSRLYERMRERDRLAALGEMAAGLAHEIRNPLGAIKGAAQFLDPRKLAGEEGEFLGVIVEEVDRLNGVVSQFLDYARPLKVQVTPIDVNDVVERTSRLVSTGLPAKVKLELRLDPARPRALSDAEQLKQVLINLVQNAVQAMPAGGTITLTTSAPDSGGFRLVSAAEHVEIRVRDTGKGIPEEEREHVFVPFYTTKEKGTGLGLAISQRIVRSHGGSLSLTSRVGEGTELVLRLPAAVEERKEEPRAPAPEPEPPRRVSRREKKRRRA